LRVYSSIRRTLRILIIILVYFSAWGQISGTESAQYRVLVLNSYHRAFPWTESIVDGILTQFQESSYRIEPTIEYLDAKRFQPETVFPLMKEMLLQKYRNHSFEAIISTDNAAFTFLLSFGHLIFPDTPVVFCGLNDFKDSTIDGRSDITGTVEAYDIAGTIELALRLHPDTTTIVVISDTTDTDETNRQNLRAITPFYEDEVEFIHLVGVPSQELAATLRELPEETIILFLNYYRDTENTVYTLQEGLSMVSTNCDFPVYSMWEDKISAGALGGIITKGELQGDSAARQVLRIIGGEPVEAIPVVKGSPNVPMFNYDTLREHHVDFRMLPADTLMVNRPTHIFYTYRYYLIPLSAFVLCLILVIAILMVNINRRKDAETGLRESLQQKDTLMKELNHRVKNNLAMISSLVKLKNASLGDHVDLSDFQSQIDAIRIVHEILYKTENVSHIDIRLYLHNLIDTIFATFSREGVKIVEEIEDVKLETKTAVSLGLVVNEIATNAIKHGFTGTQGNRFEISLHQDKRADRYQLRIANNGTPFPEEVELDNPQTLGLRLISAITKQIEGSIELSRRPSPVYTITFPREPE
jgi:two-component sensor histidine kinase/ABC-type uncharacterized transport system substrate-binding protein